MATRDNQSAKSIPETANELNLPVFKFDPEKPDEIGDGGNLCADFSEDERRIAAERLDELVEIDCKSYDDWLRNSDQYMEELLKNEAPFDETTQEETAAEETHARPSFGVVIGAVLQYNGRAIDAILGTPDLVKSSKDDDAPSTAMAKWASQEFRVNDKNWIPDTDLMTLHYSVTGLGWRKRWFNRSKKKLQSTFLTTKEVIVNAKSPRDVARIPRITHCLEYYPHEVAPMIRRGDFCDFDLTEINDDPSAPIHFREVHLWLDMDGDGIEEPWTQTYLCSGDTKILVAQFPRWCASGALREDDYWHFKPNLHFTPYHFIPNPDGSFHSLGYGWLLRRFEEASSHLLNDAIGITEKAAADGGLGVGGTSGIPETITLKRDTLNMIPGDDARSIQERIQLFPSKQMPESLPKLIEMLIGAADRLTGSTNPLNEAPADMTATLAAGLLQSNAAVSGATHRRFLEAMSCEARTMADLGIAHMASSLPPDAATVDVELLGMTADPTLATETQRATLGMYYARFMEDPLTNPIELRKRMHDLMRVPNPTSLLVPPQPPQASPDAKLKFAQEMVKHITGRVEGDARAANLFAQALQNFIKAGADLQTFLSAVPQMQSAVEGDEQNGGDGTGQLGGNGSSGMAQPPGNGGPPSLSGGQGDNSPGGMGQGGLGSPPASGAGGGLPPPSQSSP